MTPYYTDDSIALYHGDCLEVLAELDDASVDSVVTDPPYLLAFMGREWDTVAAHEHLEWHAAWTAQAFRVMRPGGHLLAFGGTRTSHRLACAIEDAGFEIRDSIAWLYGSGFPKSLAVDKAIDRAAGAEREVVGPSLRHVSGKPEQRTEGLNGSTTFAEAVGMGATITAPATDDARTWQGWGTALKPAWEVVITAQKPLSDRDYLARIGSWLAQAVDQIIPTGGAADLFAQTGTLPSGSVVAISSSTVSSWLNCWADLSEGLSTSTTETTSSTTTDLRTLCFYLGQITPASITQDQLSLDGQQSLVELVDTLFAAAVLNSRVIRTLTATGSATSKTPPTSQAEGALSQVVVARKPLAGTVAGNVLAHGTGALNVDGCRVEGDVPTTKQGGGGAYARATQAQHGYRPEGEMYRGEAERAARGGVMSQPNPTGRWPANVVLDESQAAALDEQSGETTAGAAGARGSAGAWFGANGYDGTYDVPYGDTGGASRFYFVAKADAAERVRIDGVAHPTVKPLSLMRWLVRLVTPPGGLVLEPFAGSGSTVEACILEGFRCIAVEREADYLPLVTQRIHRRRDPVEAVKATGEDGGLFDLLGGDGAA